MSRTLTRILKLSQLTPAELGKLKRRSELDIDQALAIAQEIGYPVIIKATAGGGGRGMRLVREDSEFSRMFQAAQGEADAAFGNPGVYLEKFVERPL